MVNKKQFMLTSFIYLLLTVLMSNSYLLVEKQIKTLFFIVPIFVFVNLFAGIFVIKTKSKRLKICYHGSILLSGFIPSAIASIIYHIVLAFLTIPHCYMRFIWSVVYCVCSLAIVFWNGIICVYLTSYQLGIKHRIIGILCGLIPIVNLIVLIKIIKIVYAEIVVECTKEKINVERQSQQLCKTRYPILLVHGVFFRDNRYFNYWGRIPKELKRHGATIFYGNHQSASAIADSAIELAERIKEIVKETNCEKLNIIAHSKGGLDCRYAIDKLDIAPYVASLTTVNTPHRGCLFADYLLEKIDDDIKNKVADTYNKALKKLGDNNPDFLTAVRNLTAEFCTELDGKMKVPDGIYCQSIGSVMKNSSSSRFPLNFSYLLAKHFDGENDGLVSEASFKWSDNYILLKTDKKRGISHADIIDLSRENIEGFDAREFYVKLINDLKKRGL